MAAPPSHPENPEACPGELTVLLRQAFGGDSDARDRLVLLLEPELRKIASSCLNGDRLGHSLQTTELVDELWVKLLKIRSAEIADSRHFYCLCARIMRNILKDMGRKRPPEVMAMPTFLNQFGDYNAQPELQRPTPGPVPIGLLEIDEILTRLEEIDPQKALIVELEVFLGQSHARVAETLGLSEATVRREWEAAKTWLRYQLTKVAKPKR